MIPILAHYHWTDNKTAIISHHTPTKIIFSIEYTQQNKQNTYRMSSFILIIAIVLPASSYCFTLLIDDITCSENKWSLLSSNHTTKTHRFSLKLFSWFYWLQSLTHLRHLIFIRSTLIFYTEQTSEILFGPWSVTRVYFISRFQLRAPLSRSIDRQGQGHSSSNLDHYHFIARPFVVCCISIKRKDFNQMLDNRQLNKRC